MAYFLTHGGVYESCQDLPDTADKTTKPSDTWD